MRRKKSGGLVESFLGMFSPYAAISRELQAALRLDRTPAFRSEHGRLEILLRGAGLTNDSMENRVDLALRLAATVRPLLLSHKKREKRRLASRAIAVVFEDEAIVGNGIATTRFTYLASHDNDAIPRERADPSSDAPHGVHGALSEIYDSFWP